MKKIIKMFTLVMILICVGSVGLIGCGGDNKKVSEDTLQIAIINKGYGSKFVYKLAEAYEAKTGVKTSVVKDTSLSTWSEVALKSGAKNNQVDVFFDIAQMMKPLATKGYIEGYDRAFVDLSDVFSSVAEGYGNKTIRELTSEYSLHEVTWGDGKNWGDGKQYFANWAIGLEGLMYNKALFEKYNLTVPRTTTEMFNLFTTIKSISSGSYAKTTDGANIYPFVYSGKVNYMLYPAVTWWAQYDGVDTFNNYLQGKNKEGIYTADSLLSSGRLEAFKTVNQMILKTNGYVSDLCSSMEFTDAQMYFLGGEAFMMSSGDWIEREMEENFDPKTLQISFMKMPIVSSIIDVVPNKSIGNDAKLIEVIDYVDGNGSKPVGVTDADIEYVAQARKIVCSEAGQHIMYVPIYSNMINEAKNFIKFTLSKAGQEILLENSYGNMSPLKVNINTFNYSSQLTPFEKSKYDIYNSDTVLIREYSHPMGYLGGVQLFYNDPYMESAFGLINTSSQFMTPEQLWTKDYNAKRTDWNTMMQNAGVSN